MKNEKKSVGTIISFGFVATGGFGFATGFVTGFGDGAGVTGLTTGEVGLTTTGPTAGFGEGVKVGNGVHGPIGFVAGFGEGVGVTGFTTGATGEGLTTGAADGFGAGV